MYPPETKRCHVFTTLARFPHAEAGRREALVAGSGRPRPPPPPAQPVSHTVLGRTQPPVPSGECDKLQSKSRTAEAEVLVVTNVARGQSSGSWAFSWEAPANSRGTLPSRHEEDAAQRALCRGPGCHPPTHAGQSCETEPLTAYVSVLNTQNSDSTSPWWVARIRHPTSPP